MKCEVFSVFIFNGNEFIALFQKFYDFESVLKCQHFLFNLLFLRLFFSKAWLTGFCCFFTSSRPRSISNELFFHLLNCWLWFISWIAAKIKTVIKSTEKLVTSWCADVEYCICSHSQLGILQLTNRKLRVMSLIHCCIPKKPFDSGEKNQRNYLFCCGQLLHCYPAGCVFSV